MEHIQIEITVNLSFQGSDLMSTVGSQISLWLGMSVISGFEILEYIVQVFMVLTGLQRKRKDQNVPRNGGNATAAVRHETS